ncbi:hypothetical protein Dimus_016663 [Dionaea muscipula]
MHIDAVKEFYAKLTLSHYKKKEVARLSVRGVEIEFDHLRLASILGIPGNNGICEYIKDMWEESKYIKPLEITRNRRLLNRLRVMMRHMSYVILVKDNELPYGDWMTMIFEAFNIPLVDKQGEEPKRYDYFEETFLAMCQLKRENGVWWIGTGENRRRDDEDIAPAEEVNKEEEKQNQPDFDWEAMNDEATLQGESGSDDQFLDAQVEVKEPATEAPVVPVFPASLEDSTNVQKEPKNDEESTLGSHRQRIPMPSSTHFKLILRGLVQIEFRLTWRMLKQRMQDF